MDSDSLLRGFFHARAAVKVQPAGAEAVQMVLEAGKPIAEVARDLGINGCTMGNWPRG
ncbi:hypothetical protein [Modestobacter sp. DSM 44400]|uniref:hypothetical protein n=1 Tax=Modestobacter sp. DSM 44400 TaxID=1550230 RepID=UPI001587043C|nr:hypothetical protein [Modestobacter sp. DSM 44400]